MGLSALLTVIGGRRQKMPVIFALSLSRAHAAVGSKGIGRGLTGTLNFVGFVIRSP